ncbi:membrane anchored protein in chemotaxis locus [Shewanella algidipiscicola]|uniref:Membrane anchored protein in chemotaxis locus n=1 Tax=Shewanella algidipiscicola TaxID=614070 RepID=A0ABQ4PEY7_9GAMM|nr:membrane anchored protein in chemotaxis locus [Shewanella algidipiscicola]GIU46113.1 membrane anchored protein in chemotaxis locus [Shewanella algidipiscicola]
MAKQQPSTTLLLWLFLLTMSTVVTGALYFDMRHKNSLLEAQITELENSQVLLMVPEEQAQPLADWMAANPKVTQSIIDQAKPGSQVRVEMGGAAPPSHLDNNVKALTMPPPNTTAVHGSENSDVVIKIQADELPESKDGVKVITLPHGGIRVTTRDDN